MERAELVMKFLTNNTGGASLGIEKTMTARDMTGFYALFLRLGIGQCSPHFGAISLLNCTKALEKEEKTLGKVQRIDHARGNKYILNSRRFFDLYVLVLNSNSLTKNIFHVCVFVSATR